MVTTQALVRSVLGDGGDVRRVVLTHSLLNLFDEHGRTLAERRGPVPESGAWQAAREMATARRCDPSPLLDRERLVRFLERLVSSTDPALSEACRELVRDVVSDQVEKGRGTRLLDALLGCYRLARTRSRTGSSP